MGNTTRWLILMLATFLSICLESLVYFAASSANQKAHHQVHRKIDNPRHVDQERAVDQVFGVTSPGNKGCDRDVHEAEVQTKTPFQAQPRTTQKQREHHNQAAPPHVQRLLGQQQYRWCIEHQAVNGFQMENGGGCWLPGRRMIVTDLDSTNLYRNQYEISLNPLELLSNQRIRIVGDSISRFLATALYHVLWQEHVGECETIQAKFHWSSDEFHGSMLRHIPAPANITLEWHWAPTPKDVRLMLEGLHHSNQNSLESAHHNIIGIGNHQRDKQTQQWVRNSYQRLVQTIQSPPLGDGLHDLVVQTPPRHPSEFRDGTNLALEESFNRWWARQVSGFGVAGNAGHNDSYNNESSVPVVNGFWPMQVEDQHDGIHSVTHAFYSAFLHLWRWKWMSVHNSHEKTSDTSFFQVQREY